MLFVFSIVSTYKLFLSGASVFEIREDKGCGERGRACEKGNKTEKYREKTGKKLKNFFEKKKKKGRMFGQTRLLLRA